MPGTLSIKNKSKYILVEYHPQRNKGPTYSLVHLIHERPYFPAFHQLVIIILDCLAPFSFKILGAEVGCLESLGIILLSFISREW